MDGWNHVIREASLLRGGRPAPLSMARSGANLSFPRWGHRSAAVVIGGTMVEPWWNHWWNHRWNPVRIRFWTCAKVRILSFSKLKENCLNCASCGTDPHRVPPLVPPVVPPGFHSKFHLGQVRWNDALMRVRVRYVLDLGTSQGRPRSGFLPWFGSRQGSSPSHAGSEMGACLAGSWTSGSGAPEGLDFELMKAWIWGSWRSGFGAPGGVDLADLAGLRPVERSDFCPQQKWVFDPSFPASSNSFFRPDK